MTSKVHPTANVGPDVELGPETEVGPNCVLTGRIRIGAKCVIAGHNYLVGPLTLGDANLVYPFACLGFAPQHTAFAHDATGAGLEIGDRNVFREHATVHRSTSESTPTRIGSDNWFMVGSHVGHDARIGDKCILTNNALVAGHAVLDDRVIMGGNAAIGQRVEVGRLAFLGGNTGHGRHMPPFMLVRVVHPQVGINIVGLRRSGMSRDEITNVRWAFKVLLQQKMVRANAIAALRERAEGSAAVREMIAFLERVKGPILGQGDEYSIDFDAEPVEGAAQTEELK